MNFTNFLVLLAVLLAVLLTAASCHDICDKNCTHESQLHQQYFRHLYTEVQNTSVAPWSYRRNSEEGRMPETIRFAVCSTCSVKDMVPKSISLKVYVFKRPRSHTGWCKCPYELAVGCTCVMKQ